MANQIWTVIGVALVVAVIASVATVSITGNVIKVKQTYTGTEVYTKTEIDTKLKVLNDLISACNIRLELNSAIPSMYVYLNRGKYKIELVSATDTSATIRVNGEEQKEINEGSSKIISGVSVKVESADETNLKLNAIIGVDACGSGCNYNSTQYDFNCDGKTTLDDVSVIEKLWKTGAVINTAFVVQKSVECKNLGVYLGELWKQGKTEIPIGEVTRIASEIEKCS